MENKLLLKGIPENEIAFIHDADTETKKKELFAKVRKGKVRIMFGSTFKMGAGTNCQDRLVHSHDLDCPWRPADVGRALRTVVRDWKSSPREIKTVISGEVVIRRKMFYNTPIRIRLSTS